MNTVKNLHYLETIADESTTNKIETAAEALRVKSNITFKILEVRKSSIVVRVKQEKHQAEKYVDKKALVSHAREFFEKFLHGWKIHPQAIPYVPNPVSEIDGGWVKRQMEDLDIGVKDIVQDTGVDKTNISAWANSTRPMSQPVKAMFYYYFQCKKYFLKCL